MNELDARDEPMLRRLRGAQPVATSDATRQRALAAGRAAMAPRRRLFAPAAWGEVLWRELVTPSRFAWAGVAAAWVAMGIVQAVCLGDGSPARRAAPAAIAAALEERRQLCATLMRGSESLRDEPPLRGAPTTRNEDRREKGITV